MSNSQCFIPDIIRNDRSLQRAHLRLFTGSYSFQRHTIATFTDMDDQTCDVPTATAVTFTGVQRPTI